MGTTVGASEDATERKLAAHAGEVEASAGSGVGSTVSTSADTCRTANGWELSAHTGEVKAAGAAKTGELSTHAREVEAATGKLSTHTREVQAASGERKTCTATGKLSAHAGDWETNTTGGGLGGLVVRVAGVARVVGVIVGAGVALLGVVIAGLG